MRSALIAFALFGLCVGWGFLMNTAMFGASGIQQDAGVAIGMGGFVFVVTALGAGVVYAVTRSRTKTFWGWLILILLGFALLGIGATQGLRKSATAISN